ncbi:AMM_1a_G0040730.mRNA.1.CDS.1 [Saccharomyces cerevisiae]|nr:AMM_1a_G0040730.mRNA.1.CDS.1 [Saccharomyces cerevisiae]CAI6835466.1 AMM_1a_G0040730.mRNA.1.CDS.1 [Saccharomyces cerevisiae]
MYINFTSFLIKEKKYNVRFLLNRNRKIYAAVGEGHLSGFVTKNHKISHLSFIFSKKKKIFFAIFDTIITIIVRSGIPFPLLCSFGRNKIYILFNVL